MAYCESCGNWDDKLTRGLCGNCADDGVRGSPVLVTRDQYEEKPRTRKKNNWRR
jgi:hypothetical protein